MDYRYMADLFCVGWIASWFLAIWIFHLQFFITGLFCLALGLLCSDVYKDNLKKKKKKKKEK